MARACAAVALLSSCAAGTQDVLAAFKQFEADFHRNYKEEEVAVRFENFARTLAFVTEENAKNHSYTLGINAFADMSEDEFAETHMMKKRQGVPSWGGLTYLGEHEVEAGVSLPSSVDWTQHGAVTAVKNQGQCGSCWTFSTTGAIEGAWAIATGDLVSLSEQQIVSCCHSGGEGCKGGWPYKAMEWARGQNLCTERSYPYTSGGGQNGNCQTSGCRTGVPAGGVTGYKSVQYGTEALMQAVAQQPISIHVDADSRAFTHYKSGVLQQNCGQRHDHAVLLVGYGSQNGVDYWKVKNSWGVSLGEQGYWRLVRGDNRDECGLLSGATFPVVHGSPYGSSASPAAAVPVPVAAELDTVTV